MSLLSPSFLARLEALQIGSNHRLIGRFGGEHRSKRHGHSIDFADFREYHPGDDFRRIDYHVMARLDQVLIKLFEAEDEVTLRILLDTSSSMAFGNKFVQARKLAAALGFVALTAHDAVTVHTFPSNTHPPRFSGRGGVPGLFSHLEKLEASGPTPFAMAAGHLLARPGPPGITVVISDLLTPEWEALFNLRASGSDLVVFHVLSADDVAPELTGDLELVDSEVGERITVTVTDDVAASFRRTVSEWHRSVEARTISIGGTYLHVDSVADIENLLMTSWKTAGVVR